MLFYKEKTMVKRMLMVFAVIGFCALSITLAQAAAATDAGTKATDAAMPATDTAMPASDDMKTTDTATAADQTTVKGAITQVAEDGSSLVINGETLAIDPDLKDYMNIEAGDNVELVVKTVDGKKVVTDFDYVDSE
jgi:hypothetical protein